MSSEKFENIEDDFTNLQNSISSKLNDLSKTFGEQKKSIIREIRRDIDDARALLHEMEEEVRTAPYPYRNQMNSRVKQYQQEFDQLHKKLSQATPLSNTTREELFSGDAVDGVHSFNNDSNQRMQLLKINETLDRTAYSIANCEQVAAQTDQIGVAVVDELGTQRESLIRTKERLGETDANLSQSRKVLRSMYRRVITNKMILIVVILLELGILGGVVYWKFFSK